VQRVACDPLHGLQQEAGQRHAFTPVVCGNFLTGIKDNVDKHIQKGTFAIFETAKTLKTKYPRSLHSSFEKPFLLWENATSLQLQRTRMFWACTHVHGSG